MGGVEEEPVFRQEVRFKRRSADVEAVCFDASAEGIEVLKGFCGDSLGLVLRPTSGPAEAELCTLEGDRMVVRHIALEGDWIVRDEDGFFHPCRPEVFKRLYEQT